MTHDSPCLTAIFWSYSRGNLIYWHEDNWYYEDGERHDDTRMCTHCNIPHVPYGPDACLGWKPGVKSMCCTHGGIMDAIYMTTPQLKGEVDDQRESALVV